MNGSEFMPLMVGKLFQSDFWLMANRTEKLAALTLWGKSWHQVPAGSIPDNDRILAGMSEMGDDWASVREMALHGWVKCSDGRLYHPVVCEAALVAYVGRLGYQLSSGAGNAERWKTPFDPWPLVDRIGVANDLLRAINPATEKCMKVNVGRFPPRGGLPAENPAENPACIGSGSPDDRKIKTKVKVKVKIKEEEKTVGGEPPTTPSAGALSGDDGDADAAQTGGDGPASPQTAGADTQAATDPENSDKPVMAGVEQPDWLPVGDWADFVAMRKAMGKSVPFTLAAANGIVRELGKLRDQGQDPGEVLQQSVRSGWRSVFAVKGQARPVAARESRYAAAGRSLYGGSSAGSGEVFDA